MHYIVLVVVCPTHWVWNGLDLSYFFFPATATYYDRTGFSHPAPRSGRESYSTAYTFRRRNDYLINFFMLDFFWLRIFTWLSSWLLWMYPIFRSRTEVGATAVTFWQNFLQSWTRTWSSSGQLGYVARMPAYTKRRSSLESSVFLAILSLQMPVIKFP